MKNRRFLLIMLLFLTCDLTQVLSQEKSTITVKGSQLNNVVVVLDVVKASQVYQLQCNQGAQSCATLKNGNYQMLELPKNFGMYECRDVEIYPESAAVPDASSQDKSQRLGEYCLVEK